MRRDDEAFVSRWARLKRAADMMGLLEAWCGL